jgi:hypothetical protein
MTKLVEDKSITDYFFNHIGVICCGNKDQERTHYRIKEVLNLIEFNPPAFEGQKRPKTDYSVDVGKVSSYLGR